MGAETPPELLLTLLTLLFFPDGADTCRMRFDPRQTAPTTGQAVVFYDGDIVLDGRCIGASLY